jgi:hypothetical protein
LAQPQDDRCHSKRARPVRHSEIVHGILFAVVWVGSADPRSWGPRFFLR